MGTLPKDLLSRTAEESTRLIALAQLDAVCAETAQLADGVDTGALRDFRVSVRRLRSTARAHHAHVGAAIGKKGARVLRSVQRTTGAARDAEVAHAWLRSLKKEVGADVRAGIALITEELTSTHINAEAVERARKRFLREEPALRKKIEVAEISLVSGLRGTSFGVVLGGLARTHVADLAARLLEIEHADDEVGIHDARIAGKRLRYLLEPALATHPATGATLKRLKRLQNALGDLHDTQVLGDRLSARLANARPRGRKSADALRGLVALADYVEHERLSLFAGVVRDHFGGAIPELVREVDALAVVFESAGDEETERKFLLRGKPRMRGAKKKEIEQGYLPGDRLRERLRRVTKGDKQTLLRTIKLGAGVKRIEVEEQLSEELFAALWPLTEGCRVFKTRYTVRDKGLVWEIDEFHDRDLYLAEVELPSASIDPPIPKWLAPQLEADVTDDGRYVNLNLAR